MRALLTGFRHLLSAALALVVVAALVAAPASANIRTFKVTAEGSGAYSRYDDSRPASDQLGFERKVALSFRWRVTIPRLSINGLGNVEGTFPLFASGTLTGGGTDSVVIHGRNGDEPVQTTGACVAPSKKVPAVASLRREKDAPPATEVGAHLVFRPFDPLAFEATCSGAATPAERIGVFWGGSPNAFDQYFFLPKLATDQGKVIVHVDRASSPPAACPSMETFTKSCVLTWSGKLTFDLIEVATDPRDPEGLIGPIPIGPPDPPKPAGRAPSALERLFGPLSAKASRDGRRARVKVACKAACAGFIRAYAAGGRGANASRAPGRPLASRRFAVGVGRTTTITLRFRGAARRAVRRAGAVRLVVSAGGKSRSLLARA